MNSFWLHPSLILILGSLVLLLVPARLKKRIRSSCATL